MAKVDVVVPCYNYARFLNDCVSSVLDQSIGDVRVLIIDDASSDNSTDVARGLAASDQRVRVVSHPINRGHIATYNEGIDWAESEYFLLLSADDLLAPGALERAITIMDADPRVGLTYGDSVVWARDCPRPIIEPQVTWNWSVRDLLAELCRSAANVVPTPTAIARTAVQKAVGGYRPTLPHSGDLQMWLRFAAHSTVVRIDAVQAIYRKHSSAMSNSYVAEMQRDYEQRKAAFDSFFEECGSRLPGLSSLKQDVARSLADQSFQTGIDCLRQGRIDSGLQLLGWAMSLDRRLRYRPPLWRLLRMPGPEGRRRMARMARAALGRTPVGRRRVSGGLTETDTSTLTDQQR